MTILLALVFVHPPPTPGPHLRDFEAYFSAGATWHYHGDPYSRDIWRTERTIPQIVATRDELLPFVGPPFGLPLWDALASLGWQRAGVVWSVVLGLSLAVLTFAGFAFSHVPLTPARVLGAIAIVAGFGPTISGAALGQVAVVSCAAIALAVLALRLRRGVPWSFLATLAALLQPNLAAALPFALGTARSAIAIAGAAALAAGASWLALAQYGGLPHYLDVLRAHAAAERFIAIQTTVPAVVRSFGAAPAGATWCWLLTVVLVGSILVWMGRARRYNAEERVLIACAALPLLWPFAHEHDFALVLVTAIVTLLLARGALWIVAACGTLLVSVDWLGLAQRPSGAPFEVFLALGVALGILSFAPKPLRVRDVLPVALTALVVLAARIASAHLVPVWPEALPLTFRVPASPPLDAASVWHAEQLAAGLGAIDPVWGALRLCSLLGCAALCWVAVQTLGNALPPRVEREGKR